MHSISGNPLADITNSKVSLASNYNISGFCGGSQESMYDCADVRGNSGMINGSTMDVVKGTFSSSKVDYDSLFEVEDADESSKSDMDKNPLYSQIQNNSNVMNLSLQDFDIGRKLGSGKVSKLKSLSICLCLFFDILIDHFGCCSMVMLTSQERRRASLFAQLRFFTRNNSINIKLNTSF